ncbi:MAG TPA: condensation domain-containing protein, partial [Mycobacteriales bacterium]|nr:condensation domain-containing protein [Mycobacteriales bacterium]
MPLSAGQQREWFRHEWSGPTGNVAVAVRLRGELSTEALRAALRFVAARHEALRLTFGAEGGMPFQVLAPPVRPEPAVGAIPGVHHADRERAVREALDAEFNLRFDLTAGPPWRVRVFELDSDDHVLAFTLHPLCADHHSAELVLADVARAYSAHRAGQPPPGVPLTVHYPDVVVRERERQVSGEFEEHLRHWQRRLSGLPVVELPADRPRPAGWSGRRGVVDTELAGSADRGLTGAAERRGLAPLALVVAGFAAVVARYTRADEVVLGTSLPGRAGPGLESVVGPLAGAAVLRLDVTGDPTFGELAEQAGAALEEASRHEVPFASVVSRLRPAREPSRHPLFTLAVDRAVPVTSAEFAGLRAERCEPPATRRDLDLALAVAAEPRALRLRTEYATDLFDRDRVERFVRHLCRMLSVAADDESRPLSRLGVLDHHERADLLVRGRAAPLAHRTEPLHALVSRQATRTPHGTAVVVRGRELSYAELEARAARMAAALRQRGVRPGSLVGVLCPRDINLIPCLLGVLRTGAAYVPLDPSHPADRLAMIVADAGLAALVTRQPLLDRLPAGLGMPILRLGHDIDLDRPAVSPAGPDAGGDAAVGPDALCEVLFTSGSTGRPKGVATTHRNVVSFLDGLLATVPADRFARVALGTAISFDASLVELWPPLVTGGTLVVVDNLLLASSTPGELEGITMLNSVPSVLTAYLRVAAVP